MEEYEYSFKVQSIEPYIKYCIDNNYEEISVTKEYRVVYENIYTDNLISRITTKELNGKEEIIIDFKNICSKNNDLNISKESNSVNITSENKDDIYSILETLGFYEASKNIRIRHIYKLNNVKFEIDDYILPKMQVIAIEGNKVEVDKVYKEIQKEQK